MFIENQLESAYYTLKNKLCGPTSSAFQAILKGPSREPMPDSQISFKSWINNEDSD